jgi:hypothetical protein
MSISVRQHANKATRNAGDSAAICQEQTAAVVMLYFKPCKRYNDKRKLLIDWSDLVAITDVSKSNVHN